MEQPKLKSSSIPKSTPPSQEKKGASKGLLITSLILNAALIGVLIYIIMQLGDKNDKITSMDQKISELEKSSTEKTKKLDAQESELEAILDRYKKIKAEREKLGEDNAELNEKIATIQSMVSKYKNAYFKSEKERKKYQDMVNSLNQEVTNMEQQIQQLKYERDSLSSENSNLQEQNAQLNEENTYNSDQLSIARVLKAEEIKVYAQNEKGKLAEDDENTFKAKRVSKVKITFRVAENNVALKDKKDAILRIIDPTGSVLFDLNKGGDSFTKANGSQDFYTTKVNFEFKNSRQQLAFLYESGREYTSGTYKVELFCEGHMIGKTAFKIK